MTLSALVLAVTIAPQATTLDLSTPKKTATSFCAAVQNQKWADAAKCVVDGSVAKAQPLLNSFPKGGAMRMELRQMTSETQAYTATVQGSLFYSMTIPGQPRSEKIYVENLEFQRSGKNWLIVGNKKWLSDPNSSPLAGIAAIFAHGLPKGPTMPGADEAKMTPATRTLSNLKQMAVATLMYATDNNDLLPGANWKTTLQPYLKSMDAFKSPVATVAKPSPYTFNPALHGKNLAKVTLPKTTVLIYEGKSSILNYAYGGKGAVAFADSSVRMVAKTEAAKLKWKQ